MKRTPPKYQHRVDARGNEVWYPANVISQPRTSIPHGWAEHALVAAGMAEMPFADDPVAWARNRLSEYVWSVQRRVMESVRDNRYTAVRSCHGTGKSHIASRIIGHWLETTPPGDGFAVSTAPTTPQVYAILWRYIQQMHRKGKLRGEVNQNAEWKLGGELIGYGRKPANHDPGSFQGIHAKRVLIVVDEAGAVPRQLFEAVDSLMTNEHCRALAIGNPDDPSSYFAEICKPGSGWNVIGVSAFDTPAYTGEEVPEELLELLVSEMWVEERKQRWGESSPIYISKVLGQFPDVTDDTLISPTLIREAQERELPGLGPGRYGVDVARYGADETVILRNRDGVCRVEKSTHKQSTMKTAGVVAAALMDAPNAAVAVIDSVGVGAGVYDRLEEQDLNVTAFEAGAASSNPRRYKNLRAEMWWEVRRLFEAGLIDIDPDDDRLAAQLGSIRFKHTSSGQIQIESKEDMRKRGLPSPDRADALMQSCYAGGGADFPAAQKKRSPAKKTITEDLMEREM